MDKETLIFVVAVAGSIISILVMVVIGLISWAYQRDLAEKARRIEFLEKQVLGFKDDWMGRPETQGLVSRIEQEFVGKHKILNETVADIVGSVNELRVLFERQQVVWTTQLHGLGESLNHTVATQIEKCSKALMERVSEQFKTIRADSGKHI
jgi:hypothetical protein